MFWKKKVSVSELREQEFDEVIWPKIQSTIKEKGEYFTNFFTFTWLNLDTICKRAYMFSGDLTHVMMLIENFDNFIRSDYDVGVFMTVHEANDKVFDELNKARREALEYKSKALIDNINKSQYDFNIDEFMKESDKNIKNILNMYDKIGYCLGSYRDIIKSKVYEIIESVNKIALTNKK